MIDSRAFPCSLCKKWKGGEYFFVVGFNEFHGNRPCPDCGRVSKRVVLVVNNDGSYKRTSIGCLECNPIMKHCQDRICSDCYYDGNLSLVKQNKRLFLRVFLPTAIISLIIGFFLGWLFFKKLLRRKKN